MPFTFNKYRNNSPVAIVSLPAGRSRVQCEVVHPLTRHGNFIELIRGIQDYHYIFHSKFSVEWNSYIERNKGYIYNLKINNFMFSYKHFLPLRAHEMFDT